VSNETTELPTSWMITRLGDICKTTSGGTPSRTRSDYYGGTIPWVKSGELCDGLVSEIEETITEEGLKNSSAKVFTKGTLLIALYGATVGKLGILSRESATNQAVCGIFPSEVIETKYLFWYLRSIRTELIDKGQGGAQPNISQGIVKDIQIPLSPVKDQKRIVAEIEKQFSRLDEAVASLKRIQANLKRYKAAVLKTAVEGVESKWWQPIENAIESIGQGWSPQCDREASPDLETWGVIKTTAVQPGAFIEGENKRLPEKLQPRPALEIHQNDILITRAGPRSRVGVACLVKSSRPRLMVCDKVYRLRCRGKVVRPDYLELVLNAPVIVDTLDELKTGISDSGLNLTQVRFNKLSIPLPPLTEQKVIVEEVERQLSVTEELEATIETNLKRAERLRQTILQQAFSGRLV